MERLMELAGFLAAHGIWSFDDDGTLTPMAGYEMPDGSRGLIRYLDASHDDAVGLAREALDLNRQRAAMAVTVTDGSYSAEGVATRALIVEGRQWGEDPGTLIVAVPFHQGETPDQLVVLFPELLLLEGAGQPFDLLGAFFGGVDSHGPATEFWDQHAGFVRRQASA
jgi:hypothetical protein